MPSPLPNQWASEPCLDLINSRWSDHLGTGRYFDRLSEPIWRRAFLRQWHFQVDDPDDEGARSRLLEQRAVLRRALESYMAGQTLKPSVRRALEQQMNRAPLSLSMSGEPGAYSLSLKRAGAGWDIVIAEIATSAARLISQQRSVKECANPACSWMFVDVSKPRSRRWCDVSICGSLVNVRRHRAGRRGRRPPAAVTLC